MNLVRRDHLVDDLKLSIRARPLFRLRVNRRFSLFSNNLRFCLATALSMCVPQRVASIVLHPSRDGCTHKTLPPRFCHGERLEWEPPLTTNTFVKRWVQDTQWK